MMIENGIVQLESVGYYRSPKYTSLRNLNEYDKMIGTVRILMFMTGMFIIPTILVVIPLYLKHRTFADVVIRVAESDVLEITDGISSLFCEGHTLKMNSTFNAFQINTREVDYEHKKHLRLQKSMFLPDDSLEYWGFFLNEGSFVNLSICSRFQGGQILIVRDTKDFHTCGLMEHSNKTKPEIRLNHDAIHIKYETIEEDDREQYEGEDQSDEKRSPAPIRHAHQHKTESHNRTKRSIYKTLLAPNEAILHGKTNETNDSSVSSFEETLISCHEGRILYHGNITLSDLCINNEFLEHGTHPRIQQDIVEDGYYFYIFYSDNDLVRNEVHATFNLLKTTYENNKNISRCLNKTECSFSIDLFSKDSVIIEVPTGNGIEDEDNHMMLTSTCKPRTAVYSMFLILVLISIFLSALMGSSKTEL